MKDMTAGEILAQQGAEKSGWSEDATRRAQERSTKAEKIRQGIWANIDREQMTEHELNALELYTASAQRWANAITTEEWWEVVDQYSITKD